MYSSVVIVEKFSRRAFDDLRERELDSGVWPEVPAGDVRQALSQAFERFVAIVDDDPAHADARHQEALREPAAGQNRDVSRQRRHRMELDAGEDEELVDLVGNNWQLVALGDFQNVEHVLFAEDVSARISRIIDQDRFCAFIDQAFHLLQVDLPVLQRIQVVKLHLDARAANPCCVIPSRPRHQNILARVGESSEADLERG